MSYNPRIKNLENQIIQLSGSIVTGTVAQFTSITGSISGSTAQFTSITGSHSGNSTTATTLQNSRTISSTGDVVWSVSFDGSGNVSGAAAIGTGVIVDADINASAAIADSKLATISAVGKVLNSATTATSMNSASAIVARDASGNFSAGTITATLAGNASGLSSTLAVGSGGTGVTTLAANAVLLGNGTSAIQTVAPSTSGNVLTSNGTTWISQAPAAGGASTTSNFKDDVRVAATGNITSLSGLLTIDGITVVAGDRVLVKDQNTAANRGIYVASTGSWTRATDFNTSALAAGAVVIVKEGTNNGGSTYKTTFRPTDTLGTTNMFWYRVHDDSYYQTPSSVTWASYLFSNGAANGSIPYQSSTSVTSFTTAGSSGQLLTSAGGGQPTWTSPSSLNNLNASNITTGTISNARTTAVSTNTANAIVTRDASGNFSAGTITAALAGNASSATNSTNASRVNMNGNVIDNNSYYLPVTLTSSGNAELNININLRYNPSTSTLTATNFDGIATQANTIFANNTTTAEQFYLVFISGSTTGGNYVPCVTSGLTFNPSTDTLTTSKFQSSEARINSLDSANNFTLTAGSTGGSWATYNASTHYFQTNGAFKYQMNTNRLAPYTDNTVACGSASFRWTQFFAMTSVIGTSDAREKQQIRQLENAELAVARRCRALLRAYKWNDAVAKKADNARIHFGVIAQDIQAAFEAEGLDAHQYGMFCYDSWDAEPAVLNDDGSELAPAREAGDRYGVRYDELLAFIVAALVQDTEEKQSALEARLAALESKNISN